MVYAKFRNTACRIKDGLTYKGIDVVFLENPYLRIGILLGKGSDIIEFLYKPKDIDLIWLSPYGIKNPKDFLMSKNQNAGRFMDLYEGGWQEIFPNGGSPCSYYGAEFGQHDEVSLLEWDYEIIEDKPEKIEIKLSVDTRLTPFRLVKFLSLKKDEPKLYIKEYALNKSLVDLNTIWGHHIAFGKPFLSEDCKLDIPAKKGLTYNVEGVMDDNIGTGKVFDWPMLDTVDGKKIDLSIIPPENVETSKFLYLSNLSKGEYRISNGKLNLEVKAEWNKDVMPYVWFWQEFNKTENYPWYKMARVFGLEPFSTDIMGLENTINKNRGLLIKGKSKVENYINITVSDI